jgi:pimeloyl-ACP methyl ester carboxylesterase
VAAGGRRAIAFDGFGYGHAGDAWGVPRKVDPAVAFVEGALRKAGVDRVHLVAHDVGGGSGLEWGARHPEQLRSVALVDAGMLFDYRHHDLARISRSRPAGEAFWLNTNRASFAAGIQNGQAPNKPLPPSYVNRLYDDLDRGTRCSIIGLYRQNEEAEIRALARSQARSLSRWRKRPALVIWGERDPYLPVKHAFQQRRGLPSARVEIFEQSGHSPFADSPERFRNVLVPFLLRAQAGDRSGGDGQGATRTGTAGDDTIVGTNGNDVIRAGAGNDRVDGRGGDDFIAGGSGNDRLAGGAGDDELHGGSGDDRLEGGLGDDRLRPGGGRDSSAE